MVGVVQTAMGSRSQPLLFIITTAGFNIQSPAYEEERYLSRILEDVVSDDSYFGIIYTLDDDDDWRDPSVWMKSNPNLGVGKHREQIENLITEAENKPSTKQQVLTKELSVWTQGLSTWLDFNVWKQNNATPFSEDVLTGRVCYAALDASMSRDHTVVTYCFPPEHESDKWRYIHRIWVPADNLEGKAAQDGADYSLWLRNGWIQYPGETIIRDQVTRQIRDDMKKYDIRELAYDRYGDGQPIALDLEEDGLPVGQFPQSAKEFTAPTNEFERLVLSGEMQHGGNPVMDYYVMSAHIYEGPNDQRKPVKYKQGDDTSRIDGLITSVMATWRALLKVSDGKSVYSERGILVL
jgi:phage terminase large subunit-like protein